MTSDEKHVKDSLDELVAESGVVLLSSYVSTGIDGKVIGEATVAYRKEECPTQTFICTYYCFLGRIWLHESLTSISDSSLDKIMALRGK